MALGWRGRGAAAVESGVEPRLEGAVSSPVGGARPESATQSEGSLIQAVARACADDNPFFAVSRLTRRVGDEAPACVIAFNDTPGDFGDRLDLGSWADLGAVYGLAYDWSRGHLYVAAYHRVGAAPGAGGLGQIYRIDLWTGLSTPFARLDAGTSAVGSGPGADREASRLVGRIGLGDIDINAAGTELLVANLHDRRVHRLRLPDGASLPSVPFGSSERPWADNARPFGLGALGAWFYQGVVELPEAGSGRSPVAHLYRSRTDGTGMSEVAAIDLGYRASAPWSGWSEAADGPLPEPMLVDIAFRPDGAPIVGLRDRRGDAGRWVSVGDVLALSGDDGHWAAAVDPDHYADRFVADESLLGGLAAFPGADLLVATASMPLVPGTAGAAYLDNATGRATGRETVAFGAAGGADAIAALGDIEALCGPPGAPTLAPTPTSTASPTPTPRPLPAYLPLAVSERCPDLAVDVVLALDLSTSMLDPTADGVPKHVAAADAAARFIALLDPYGGSGDRADRVALVGFNATAWSEVGLTSDLSEVRAGLLRLPGRLSAGSRLDLALLQAARCLPPDPQVGRVRAVLVLGDGILGGVPVAEDGRPETTVMRAVAPLPAAGVLVFAVGFGRATEVDSALLRRVAGDPARYRDAADARALLDLFGTLAAAVRCPGAGRFWPATP